MESIGIVTQHVARRPADKHRRERVDASEGVRGHVHAAASLSFFLAARGRQLSLSESLGWAEGGLKSHARNKQQRRRSYRSLERILRVRGLYVL